jgi:hypothetical protein
MTRRQRRLEAQRQIIQHFEQKIPNFIDLFDERTFYVTFGCLVVFAIILAIVLSICCNVKIKDADEIDRERERRKRRKQIRIAEKMLKKKMAEAANDPTINMNEIARLEKFLETMRKLEKQENDESLLADDTDQLIEEENDKNK